mmetsp:Transcript_28762/g.57938  ORF Transcript_28762/g.57938 Transcript_28762/m.57938 type:complete len:83 (+) Transcript_28762:2216-2464(+)
MACFRDDIGFSGTISDILLGAISYNTEWCGWSEAMDGLALALESVEWTEESPTMRTLQIGAQDVCVYLNKLFANSCFFNSDD